MIGGNARDFVDYIYYGQELWFIYDGTKYFLEGSSRDDINLELMLCQIQKNGKIWWWTGNTKNFPVEEFLSAPVFNNKTFWEVEKDITWVDCF